MSSMNGALARSDPFINTLWLKEFLPFNPSKDSTYCEFEKGEKLYPLIGSFIVKQSTKSYKFKPKKNASKATRILEKLARIAKHHKDNTDLNDDEKKEYEQKLDEKELESQQQSDTLLGLGLHQFNFENTKFYALHQTVGNPVSPGGCGGNPTMFTSLVLFVEGEGKVEILRKFIDFIIKNDETKKDALFFKIYRFHMKYKFWQNTGKKIARDPATIILPSATWTQLMDDFERFIDEKSIKWYFKHGIPYKRSYLFYGVPGSGKSSLIQALAAKYDRNLCFLQPTHSEMTDETFKTCIQSAPGNSLIVFEDIDALFNKDRSKKHSDCPLTFSGLLNGLDGVGNPDGQIFIMTTNFVDKLDNALIRSGRVDLHIEFPLATDEQLNKIFLLFYPNSAKLSKEFVKEIRTNFVSGISMAAVQQHFIQNMFADPKVVVDTIKSLGDRLDVVTKYDKEKEEEKKKKEEEEKKEKEKEKEKEEKKVEEKEKGKKNEKETENENEKKDKDKEIDEKTKEIDDGENKKKSEEKTKEIDNKEKKEKSDKSSSADVILISNGK